MSNKYRYIHETVITDVLDAIKTVGTIAQDGGLDRKKNKNVKSFRSITKASSGMTLVFPVACTRSISYETASMLTKSIERKCVSMMQMLFSAYQISNVENVNDFIAQFHSNMRIGGRYTIDDFINDMDSLTENYNIDVNRSTLNAIKEDMKNINFYLESDLDNGSYSNYSVKNNKIISEGAPPNRVPVLTPDSTPDPGELGQYDYHNGNEKTDDSQGDKNRMENWYKKQRQNREEESQGWEREKHEWEKKDRKTRNKRDKSKDKREKERHEWEKEDRETRNNRDASRDRREEERYLWDRNQARNNFLKNQILDSDIKKANELQPSLMIVNFMNKDASGRAIPVDGVVIGIKAKLIGLDSIDIVDHLTTKNSDKNFLLQLCRASTREISFFKDFIFAIDSAKIDALNNSKAGSTSPMWKVLEKRALKSKFRRFSNGGNDAAAITTLIISQSEVEYLRKENNVDMMNPRVIGPIMEAYNFMGVVIVDELLEVAHFMWDTGDDTFEDISFNNLTRESADKNYKKVINLMTKLA